MGKLYWLGVIFVFGLGLFTAWYVADQRQNQILLKPQSFQSAEDLWKSLEPLLEPSHPGRKWIFVGLELQNPIHSELAKRLVENHKDSLVILDHFLQAADIKSRVDFVMNLQHLRDQLLLAINQKSAQKSIVIIAPNIYFSHVPFDSLSNSYLGTLRSHEYTVLTMTSFPLGEEENQSYYLPCSESQQLQTSLSDMGCYIRRQAILRSDELSRVPAPHGFLVRYNDSELILFTRAP
jgi:hypothetical protein